MAISLNILPIDVSVALHYYYMSCAYPYIEAQGVIDSITKLRNLGIVTDSHSAPFVELTDKGRVWVGMILSTPFPVQQTMWAHPVTGETIHQSEV